MARRIIIETDLTCEHGITGRNHLVTTNERKRDGSAVSIECVAGTEVRVIEPGEFVLIEKVDGEWPITNEGFAAVEDALVSQTGHASMRAIETTLRTYWDALAGGEQ